MNTPTDGRYTITGWTLIGASYRHGYRVPGATVLQRADGVPLYFAEGVSLTAAVERSRAAGYDCRIVQAKIDQWVATGSPEGWEARRG